ncbi:MAG: response regulator, partial [Planctomycetaceae bacterium]
KLGGQAEVKGVSGTWKDLTENVNNMASNLTSQVRGIAKVVTAVTNGEMMQKLTVEAKGEIAALAETINNMIDTLATFADQVTTVAREVGVEGKLGGQASVPGAAGTWKDLTDNVNQLAANLTTQVRAIAEVATAVTKGDLTRSTTAEALGEVAALKDNINEMIRNLKDTTLKNSEQDWLKTNLAKFSRMLQGQKDLLTVGRLILSELAPVVTAQHGMFYILDTSKESPELSLLASYAYKPGPGSSNRFQLGEGLVGQCAVEREKILLTNVPAEYVRISSGLGDAPPVSIILLPVLFEGQVKAVLELASFERFNPTHEAFLDQLMESIGIVLNTIEANMLTEDLLKQSQSLANELQSRQQELQNTNQELQEKARLLVEQNEEVEMKNEEVEQARQALEDKAQQLALTSKYKSEFLANMSHELRTPLNSLLILSDQLSKNADHNLTEKQVEFAKTIHSSGNDLLMLINDILDLSKIESGTVVVDVNELRFPDLVNYIDRTFSHVADSKSLEFVINMSPHLPTSILTDSKRLQQIIRNLLSNAFKFTPRGRVALTVEPVSSGWNPQNEHLNNSPAVISISVSDTGIGIAADKQQIIFEAFQQADGSTSRKYGGTGLGLAISREIARLLGGEIRLVSAPGRGSTFTLYLPSTFTLPKALRRQTSEMEASPPQERESAQPIQTHPASRFAAAARVSEAALEYAETIVASPDSHVLLNELGDDRDRIQPGDQVLLVVDNDLAFARLLIDAARENGFKAIASSLGAAAITLAREYKPQAITLDIKLPDIDGWRVLNRLKNDPTTRHIPVSIISTDEDLDRGLQMGAVDITSKPIRTIDDLNAAIGRLRKQAERPRKRLMIVEPKPARRKELVELLGGDDLETVTAKSAAEASKLLAKDAFDCLVLPGRLPDMSFGQFTASLAGTTLGRPCPMVVFEDSEESSELAEELDQVGRSLTLKRVSSDERMLDQVSLFLHRPMQALSEPKRQMLELLSRPSVVLAGKKVLVVDDDTRNIFAMVSVLEDQQMLTTFAVNGRDAIEILQRDAEIDIVLMDIMMPEMDGIDTMREIRRSRRFKNLPIIAVTAKAMKGDRERCIEAGAWDYLPKPVDPQQLLSVLSAWLSSDHQR